VKIEEPIKIHRSDPNNYSSGGFVVPMGTSNPPKD